MNESNEFIKLNIKIKNLGKKVLVIRIQKSFDSIPNLNSMPELLKFRTEGIWRLSHKRANELDYICAYFNDRIQHVYKINKSQGVSRFNRDAWMKVFKINWKYNYNKEKSEYIDRFENPEMAFETWLQDHNLKTRLLFNTSHTSDLSELINKSIPYWGQNPCLYLGVKLNAKK